jgi:hypothetical protein
MILISIIAKTIIFSYFFSPNRQVLKEREAVAKRCRVVFGQAHFCPGSDA